MFDGRSSIFGRLRLKCDCTRAETRFCLSAKRTSPFKPAGASVQSTTRSRGVRIRGSNAEYTMFRGSVKSTGYPLHSPVSPSLPLMCVTVCHYISTGLYSQFSRAPHYVQTDSGARTERKASKIRLYVLHVDTEAFLSNSQCLTAV